MAGILLAGVLGFGTAASLADTADLAITSLGADGELVFRTRSTGTPGHHDRVELSSALNPANWMPVRTVSGVGGARVVSNALSAPPEAAFYRVVSTSNSSEFVDGPYMAIDISGGPAALDYPVSFYPKALEVPGTFTNDLYKTTQILLRRIPAGTFTMGSPEDELGRLSNEPQRQVTLTQDFYIGVFEVTQKQWERVMGDWPSWFTNVTHRDSRPVENVSYHDIRENGDSNTPISPNWPQSSAVGASSFVGKLRAKTGLSTFDLPTEAQWEYACRAGTTTALNSGKNLSNTGSCPNMSEVGRYWYDGGSGYSQGGGTSVGTAEAGSYLPNAWGLYDMHGNEWEWCLDWYTTTAPGSVDPVGAASGSFRVLRGGSWSYYARYCRSAGRNVNVPSSRFYDIGFRLSRTLP